MMKTQMRLSEGDYIELKIPLSEVIVLENIIGKVLESTKIDDGFYRTRVEFTDISQSNRDEIVKFVYEELEKGAREVPVELKP